MRFVNPERRRLVIAGWSLIGSGVGTALVGGVALPFLFLASLLQSMFAGDTEAMARHDVDGASIAMALLLALSIVLIAAGVFALLLSLFVRAMGQEIVNGRAAGIAGAMIETDAHDGPVGPLAPT